MYVGIDVAKDKLDLGRFRGKRFIRGGRPAVRCTLYMGALAAMRFNPVIAAFAERLRKTGKTAKQIIVACMRKLLCLLNAMVRDHLTWPQFNVVKFLKTT